jgi:hypothetical protein
MKGEHEMAKEMNQVRQSLHAAKGQLNYYLECFGDELAKKSGYKGLKGMDAIWLYLIRTYHWTPAYVKAMNQDDIRLVLSQEMEGFAMPSERSKGGTVGTRRKDQRPT